MVVHSFSKGMNAFFFGGGGAPGATVFILRGQFAAKQKQNLPATYG